MRTRTFNESRNFRWALVALLAPGVLLAPAASHAQNTQKRPDVPPFATLKVYEVQEATDFKGGTPEAPALRLANATLVGTASGGLCTAGQDPCAFDTMALSEVPLKAGVGQLHGDFQVMFDTLMNPGHLLSDLVLVAKGSVRGLLDLRPLLTRTAPMALMRGKWKSESLESRGTFKGTFLVPFPDPTKTCATGFAYLDPDAGLQCLEANEVSLGRPLTKVVATFVRTGPFGSPDHDEVNDPVDGGQN